MMMRRMHSGKNQLLPIVYDAMKTIEERTGSDPSKRLKERCGMPHL